VAAAKCTPFPMTAQFAMARVLVVDDNPTSRLTLQTVLQASGYAVDTAASAAEAIRKMDDREYALVLSDLEMESPESGLRVMAHARAVDYRPASAILSTSHQLPFDRARPVNSLLIQPQDIPELLGRVADMISARAQRLLSRSMRGRN